MKSLTFAAVALFATNPARAAITLTQTFSIANTAGSDTLGLHGATATVTITISDSASYIDVFPLLAGFAIAAPVDSATMTISNSASNINDGIFNMSAAGAGQLIATPNLGSFGLFLATGNPMLIFESIAPVTLNSGTIAGFFIPANTSLPSPPAAGTPVSPANFAGMMPANFATSDTTPGNTYAFTAIPEPSLSVLSALGLTTAFLRRRRTAC